MDRRFRFDFNRVRSGISKRIPRLSRNSFRTKRVSALLNPTFKSGVLGVAFLVLAGVLAWGAQDVTYSQALHDWELRRTPSDRIWEHSLASRGFSSPKDLKLIHSVLRKLPATLDLPGSVWMDRTASWVIVFSASEKTLPQRVFCLECKRPPEGFEPQGRGWAGYDRAHEAIEHMESRRIKPESPKKAHEFRDPRAIQY